MKIEISTLSAISVVSLAIKLKSNADIKRLKILIPNDYLNNTEICLLIW